MCRTFYRHSEVIVKNINLQNGNNCVQQYFKYTITTLFIKVIHPIKIHAIMSLMSLA